ncbi:MAG: gfo/Idh/MocA family oxidoreductase, partial [Candidatus Binataceae bacterium]
LMEWVSELGHPKDAEVYGGARRKLGGLARAGEVSAKLGRTYGRAGSTSREPIPPHHEHFGFVLVTCERADLRLTPSGVWIYADTERRFVAHDPPVFPRGAVIDEFVAAVRGERRAIHDGAWGVATVTCCDALLRSSAEKREIILSSLS